MPRPFHNQFGVPVAYTDDDEHIYTFPGQPVAYLFNESAIVIQASISAGLTTALSEITMAPLFSSRQEAPAAR
jgi:hypothetical protein